MPKMKTHRGAAKRMTAIGSGRFKRGKAGHRHKLAAKTPKQKRRLGAPALVDRTHQKAAERMLPYADKK
jgi:large subunit ribosomal protein L35